MSGIDPLANVVLRPWPVSAKEALTKEDLLLQVEQLATGRKQPLRDITEKVLQDDIAAGRDGLVDSKGGEQDQKEEEEAPSSQETLEKIARTRHEVFTKLEWTSFAAGNALNLVSIILSRDLTKYPGGKEPDNIYTPVFRDMGVPRGSFGLVKGTPLDRSDRPEERERVASTARRKLLAMKGSRMEALDWATDNLLKAATDLETNIRKETKYWDEILSISDKGWPLQRTRRGVRNAPFAVKYGPAEASNHFRARGVAPLRMDSDGGIILDPALTKKPKGLRVRISENDKIIGTSQATIKGGLDGLAIERSIQLARESLIEEELFHEMSLESRQLLAYGVELRDTVIHVAVPSESGQSGHRKILIDCMAEDDQALSTPGGTQNWLAQDVAEALRLLLAHEHRMRLFRRTQIPPPMTQHKRNQPTPPLFRTLLGMFSHLNAVNSLYAYLGAIVKTLKSASLDTTLEISRETNWEKLTETIKEADTKDLPATDQLLAVFIRPFEGKASLSLPSSSGGSLEHVIINTRTYIGLPHFGTEHKVSLPPSLINLLNLEHDPMRQLKFSSTEEVRTYLDWLVSLDIAQNLLFNEFNGRSIIKSSDPCISVMSKGSKKGFVKEDDVEIELEKATLKATATAHGQLATGVAVESFTWTGTPGRPALKAKWPTGIAVSRQGRKFSNYPPGLDANNTNDGSNGKYTVAELIGNYTERPYPNAEINSPPGGAINYSTYPATGANYQNFLIGVQSVVLDAHDRLWILDTGRALTPNSTLVPASYGGPKLLAVDLSTNQVVKTIVFPPTVAFADSYLNDVRFDLRPSLTSSGQGVAYITDSSTEGRNGIIIVDLGTAESWRHLDGTAEVRPQRGFVASVWGEPLYYIPGPGQPLSYTPFGSDGIALGADGEDLFWTAVGSRTLYSLSTERLRDRTLNSELQAQNAIRNRGEKGVSDGMETDTNGYIYAGNMEQNAISFFNPANASSAAFVRDPRINWVDTMATGADGYLYFTVNQLSFSSAFYPGIDRRERPFVLFRAQLPGNGTRVLLQ
ncbi:RNA polymerase II mediator complex subunit [Kalmusia sp. IMI 367209]|nr:RNA polymerase II mediator complex subunit [Kalmusia sp. IMI 367209]